MPLAGAATGAAIAKVAMERTAAKTAVSFILILLITVKLAIEEIADLK